jgi:hypothetical protein
MHFVYLSSVRGTNTCTLFICHLSIYSFDISVALLWHFKTFLLFKVLIVLILLNYFIIYLVFITEILNVWFKLKPVLHNPYRTPFGTSLISTLKTSGVIRFSYSSRSFHPWWEEFHGRWKWMKRPLISSQKTLLTWFIVYLYTR